MNQELAMFPKQSVSAKKRAVPPSGRLVKKEASALPLTVHEMYTLIWDDGNYVKKAYKEA